MDVCRSQEIYRANFERVIRYWFKNRIRCRKNCCKKIVYKTAEATEHLIENKTTEKIVRPKPLLE